MIVLVWCERGVNVWVPHQEKVIIQELMGDGEKPGIIRRNL